MTGSWVFYITGTKIMINYSPKIMPLKPPGGCLPLGRLPLGWLAFPLPCLPLACIPLGRLPLGWLALALPCLGEGWNAVGCLGVG
jgi:hypothetical protein